MFFNFSCIHQCEFHDNINQSTILQPWFNHIYAMVSEPWFDHHDCTMTAPLQTLVEPWYNGQCDHATFILVNFDRSPEVPYMKTLVKVDLGK